MKYAIINKVSRIIENVVELNEEGDLAPTDETYLEKDADGLAVIGRQLDAENAFLIPEPAEGD